MKFSNLREFRGESPKEVEEDVNSSFFSNVFEYLSVDLVSTLKNLSAGLRKLSFEDNFQGWIEKDITLGVGSDRAIPNQLSPEIPTQRIVVKGGPGAQDITDGNTAWTQNLVYLRNNGASPVTVNVIFLK